jgi:hypothetical protein
MAANHVVGSQLTWVAGATLQTLATAVNACCPAAAIIEDTDVTLSPSTAVPSTFIVEFSTVATSRSRKSATIAAVTAKGTKSAMKPLKNPVPETKPLISIQTRFMPTKKPNRPRPISRTPSWPLAVIPFRPFSIASAKFVTADAAVVAGGACVGWAREPSEASMNITSSTTTNLPPLPWRLPASAPERVFSEGTGVGPPNIDVPPEKSRIFAS